MYKMSLEQFDVSESKETIKETIKITKEPPWRGDYPERLLDKDEIIRASLQIIIQCIESQIGLNLSVHNDIFQMKSIG